MRPRASAHYDEPIKPVQDGQAIVIVGAGISGAVAALEAAKQGYLVTVVAKHPYAVRPQSVKISDEAATLLKPLLQSESKELDDIVMLADINKNLSDNKNIVQLAELESALLRKLKSHSNITFIEGEVATVDKANSRIMIKSLDKPEQTQNIPFFHLVDASGNARSTFEKKDQNEFKNQPIHSPQGTIILTANKPVTSFKSFTDRFRSVYKPSFSPEEIKKLNDDFGWEHNYPPEVYILPNKDRTEFYVGGDIPKAILEIKNYETRQEALIKWSQHILQHQLGTQHTFNHSETATKHLTEEQKEALLTEKKKQYQEKFYAEDKVVAKSIQQEEKISTTVFDLRLKYLVDPARNISEKKDDGIVQAHVAIGDALQSPHFHRSHGVTDAVRGAHAFVNCLPKKDSTNQFNLEQFKQFTSALHKEHEKRLEEVAVESSEKIQKYRPVKLSNTDISALNKINNNFLHIKMKLEKVMATNPNSESINKCKNYLNQVDRALDSVKQFNEGKISAIELNKLFTDLYNNIHEPKLHREIKVTPIDRVLTYAEKVTKDLDAYKKEVKASQNKLDNPIPEEKQPSRKPK